MDETRREKWFRRMRRFRRIMIFTLRNAFSWR
jgi:hypothetical protein